MGAPDLPVLFFALAGLLLAALSLFFYWLSLRHRPLALARHRGNPILSPNPQNWWESEAVFNPAAIVHDERVHLFYRALGRDGISRIGHATSGDGINFGGRTLALDPSEILLESAARRRHGPRAYSPDVYASGGGWGGFEDPRAVKIEEEGRAYLSFGMFESWQSLRLALTSLPLGAINARVWDWPPPLPLSPKNEMHKNWVLFPEKINGKFAILHALTPSIMIDYIEDLECLREWPIKSNNNRGGRSGQWDAFVRGAGAPPVKTPAGWLLFYHGMNPAGGPGYKVGAMLLDLGDPTKVLYRSNYPVLEPEEWYENDWKPGVVYASGAVILRGDLIVYYGGGGKHVAAARVSLREFLLKLQSHEHAVLEPVTL